MIADHLLEKLACAKPNTLVVLFPAFIALAVVVIADHLTGFELSLGPFYVLVILPVSWYCGAWWSALFVCLSVFAQIQVRLLLGNHFSESIYFYVGNGNKLFSYLLISILAVTARRLFIRATAAARMDHLTGLINNMGFYERLSVELARHRRHGYCFGVAYIDCDHFKEINDGLGHAEGDRVLQAVGEVLKSNSRESDVVGRLGGDEFAIAFPQTAESEVLQAVNKLRQQLDLSMTKHEWPITFSIGVGVFPTVPENADRVITFADQLMYSVKLTGKNSVMLRVYDPQELGNTMPAIVKAT